MVAIRLRLLGTLLFAGALAGCGDSTGTGRVDLQFATRAMAPAAAASAAFSTVAVQSQTVISLGGGQIVPRSGGAGVAEDQVRGHRRRWMR